MKRPGLGDVARGALARESDTAAAQAAHRARYGEGAGPVDHAAGAARYYDLVTDFYEYGWGQSFHFAPRFRGESLPASLARLEHLVALRLGLGPGQLALDAGCGIGGPMRAIARFSGARVLSVTINAYQARRGSRLHAQAGLAGACRSLCADYGRLPFPDARFDAAYTLEALCHAARRAEPLRELARVLKPGGLLAGTDWCLTERYRPEDLAHARVARGIEEGNGLAPLVTVAEFRRDFAAAGLELLETRDLAEAGPHDEAWYAPLQAGWRSPTELRRTRLGRRLTAVAVRLLEALGLAPRGTVATSDLLNRAADALVAGGATGIFTPLFFFIARRG